MTAIATRQRRPGASSSVSVGITVSILVLIAVALTFLIDGDDSSSNRDAVRPTPQSFIVGGSTF